MIFYKMLKNVEYQYGTHFENFIQNLFCFPEMKATWMTNLRLTMIWRKLLARYVSVICNSLSALVNNKCGGSNTKNKLIDSNPDLMEGTLI